MFDGTAGLLSLNSRSNSVQVSQYKCLLGFVHVSNLRLIGRVKKQENANILLSVISDTAGEEGWVQK